MPFNTLTVGAAVTPSVIETYFSHYLNRAPLRQKPTAHISYHEGLKLIRQFLDYSSRHTVDDLQAFTAQWVPAPHWVRINDAEVAPKFLERAAHLVQDHLGFKGIEKVGGESWWQWRRPDTPLRAEWIEMKKEYHDRKRTGAKCERVILYVHGGAYYFGSVDEHRYQMQRHARKLKARVLAPRYRLAPQFPFPCGLYDCLATYFYLLEHFEPTQILFAGDSAGGGMVLSMLVILRDQGQPLPAGTILLSPWVDLTHSFPSVAGNGEGDYIPPHGFLHKPSMAWPPPPTEAENKSSGMFGAPTDAVELPATAGLDMKRRKKNPDDIDGDDEEMLEANIKKMPTKAAMPSFGHNLGIVVDGNAIELRDQIQMYTTNELLAHPLVSPVMQPSLGGLPPMLIQVGSAELLRDEQIYLAHKAANPKAFPPSEHTLNEYDPERKALDNYPPTDVQLQVWDDLCHVPHTLSFTRPAKYMYRSVAQFGAWALARAQQKGIDIQNDDTISIISSGSGAEDDDSKSTLNQDLKDESGNAGKLEPVNLKLAAQGAVGKAGDPLPPFKNHMIRQRVTRHGIIYPLAPSSEIACLALDPLSIGTVKPGPVRKWLNAKQLNDQRFANDKKKIQKKLAKELAAGYDEIVGERPPPTALVRRKRNGIAPEQKKKGKSWGLAMWSGWGSSHDEHTLQREQRTEKNAAAEAERSQSREPSIANGSHRPENQEVLAAASNGNLAVPEKSGEGNTKRRSSSASMFSSHVPWSKDKDRPRSPYRQVTDRGQADSPYESPFLGSSARSPLSRRTSTSGSTLPSRPVSVGAYSPIPMEHNRPYDAPEAVLIPTTSTVAPQSEKIPETDHTYLSPTSTRPHNGTMAYPFKLRTPASNPSIATLESVRREGTSTPASFGAHNELAGDAPAPVELSGVSASGPSVRRTTPEEEQTRASVINGVNTAPSELEEATPASSTDVVPLSATITDVESAPQLPMPELLSPLEAPQREARESLTADPIEGDSETDSQPKAVVERKSRVVPEPLKFKNTVFDPRTSLLGSLGADGMPNAHHDFHRHTIVGHPSPGLPIDEPSLEQPSLPKGLQIGARPKAPVEVDSQARHTIISLSESAEPSEPSPSSIAAPLDVKRDAARVHDRHDAVVEEPRKVPFKMRNPVFDPRAPSPSGFPSEFPPPPLLVDASKSSETTKAPPFKLRHTIYEPKFVPYRPGDEFGPISPQKQGSVTPPIENIPPITAVASSLPRSPQHSSNGAENTRDLDSSPSYETMPRTNTTVSETGTGKPVALEKTDLDNLDDERPPPPPPKDEVYKLNVEPRNGKMNIAPSQKISNISNTNLSHSKAGGPILPSPPMIGDLSFERKDAAEQRPPLETFVTASEGKNLHGSWATE